MANLHDSIDDRLKGFIQSQPVFFVATSPGPSGHVNLSPKGLDPVVVLAPDRVAYADRTGSGIETVAHLGADGRITLMFCAFTGAPDIVRLHGTGRVVRPDDSDFADLAVHFDVSQGLRSIIDVAVTRVSDSCGYGVPLMKFKGDRRTLVAWAANKTDAEITEYHRTRNATSIDGIPGM